MRTIEGAYDERAAPRSDHCGILNLKNPQLESFSTRTPFEPLALHKNPAPSCSRTSCTDGIPFLFELYEYKVDYSKKRSEAHVG